MVVARRNGVSWEVKLPTLVAILTAIALIGTGVIKSVDWLGWSDGSPGRRLRVLEARADTTTELLRALVVFQCLSTDSTGGMMIARARVPCARELKAQGVMP